MYFNWTILLLLISDKYLTFILLIRVDVAYFSSNLICFNFTFTFPIYQITLLGPQFIISFPCSFKFDQVVICFFIFLSRFSIRFRPSTVISLPPVGIEGGRNSEQSAPARTRLRLHPRASKWAKNISLTSRFRVFWVYVRLLMDFLSRERLERVVYGL